MPSEMAFWRTDRRALTRPGWGGPVTLVTWKGLSMQGTALSLAIIISFGTQYARATSAERGEESCSTNHQSKHRSPKCRTPREERAVRIPASTPPGSMQIDQSAPLLGQLEGLFPCPSHRGASLINLLNIDFQLINGSIAACEFACGLCLTTQVAAASLVRGCWLASIGGGLFTRHTEWRVGHPGVEERRAERPRWSPLSVECKVRVSEGPPL